MISIRLRGIQNYSDMKRYGSVIRVRPEKLEEYKKLHAEVWPGVRRMIAECGLRNYSIYYKDGFLFSYYEYVGDDYAADMAKMAADPETQRWWAVCEPCQQPLDTRAEGEWWASMEEVFHKTEHRSASFGFIVSGLIFWKSLVYRLSRSWNMSVVLHGWDSIFLGC